MQQHQAVVGEQYCSKQSRAYTVQPKNRGYFGGAAAILDDQGSLVYSVDGKTQAIAAAMVLKDAAGNPICALQGKVTALSTCMVAISLKSTLS